MSDLVKRLREEAPTMQQFTEERLLLEAADEIERLTLMYGIARRELGDVEQRAERLAEALIHVLASLVAAHDLLSRGGKRAAASDTMFNIMLNDYQKAIDAGRAALAEALDA